jgi:hypothetical protein
VEVGKIEDFPEHARECLSRIIPYPSDGTRYGLPQMKPNIFETADCNILKTQKP